MNNISTLLSTLPHSKDPDSQRLVSQLSTNFTNAGNKMKELSAICSKNQIDKQDQERRLKSLSQQIKELKKQQFEIKQRITVSENTMKQQISQLRANFSFCLTLPVNEKVERLLDTAVNIVKMIMTSRFNESDSTNFNSQKREDILNTYEFKDCLQNFSHCEWQQFKSPQLTQEINKISQTQAQQLLHLHQPSDAIYPIILWFLKVHEIQALGQQYQDIEKRVLQKVKEQAKVKSCVEALCRGRSSRVDISSITHKISNISNSIIALSQHKHIK